MVGAKSVIACAHASLLRISIARMSLQALRYAAWLAEERQIDILPPLK
jgi:hypothetical protein